MNPPLLLDVTIQAQIVDLVKRLRDEMGMAIIWITHDLGVVASIAHRVAVMYGGYIIEESDVKDLYANPTHPYTLGLLGSLPHIQEKVHTRLFSIEGMPPVLYQKPVFLPVCSPLHFCNRKMLARKSVTGDLCHQAIAWRAGLIPKPGVSDNGTEKNVLD